MLQALYAAPVSVFRHGAQTLQRQNYRLIAFGPEQGVNAMLNSIMDSARLSRKHDSQEIKNSLAELRVTFLVVLQSFDSGGHLLFARS